MNTLYADIIVDISHEKLDRTFQYRVPESLRGRLEPGACVMIPFGNGNRLIKGYVVALGETCQFAPEKIKDIAGMPEKETGVEDKMIALDPSELRLYHDPGAEDGTAGKTVGKKAGTQTAGTSDEQRRDFVIIRRM